MWELVIDGDDNSNWFEFEKFDDLMKFIRLHQLSSNILQCEYTLWFEEN